MAAAELAPQVDFEKGVPPDGKGDSSMGIWESYNRLRGMRNLGSAVDESSFRASRRQVLAMGLFTGIDMPQELVEVYAFLRVIPPDAAPKYGSRSIARLSDQRLLAKILPEENRQKFESKYPAIFTSDQQF